jgi:hypothetical protein
MRSPTLAAWLGPMLHFEPEVSELTLGASINPNSRQELPRGAEGRNLPRMIDNQKRAARYRQLALAEPDKERASLLNRLADEAERGMLCTADRKLSQPFPPPHRAVDTD